MAIGSQHPDSGSPAAFIGLILMVVIVVVSFSQYSKAQAYMSAEQDYRERRARIERGETPGGFNIPGR